MSGGPIASLSAGLQSHVPLAICLESAAGMHLAKVRDAGRGGNAGFPGWTRLFFLLDLRDLGSRTDVSCVDIYVCGFSTQSVVNDSVCLGMTRTGEGINHAFDCQLISTC